MIQFSEKVLSVIPSIKKSNLCVSHTIVIVVIMLTVLAGKLQLRGTE